MQTIQKVWSVSHLDIFTQAFRGANISSFFYCSIKLIQPSFINFELVPRITIYSPIAFCCFRSEVKSKIASSEASSYALSVLTIVDLWFIEYMI